MSQQDSYTATVEVASVSAEAPEEHGGGAASLIHIDVPLMILTWGTFILMTVVLYKIAWKPILKALDMRESSIRKAMEDAEKARAETAAADVRRQRTMEEARQQAKETMAAARQAAMETAQLIQARANEEAKAMVADARREIQAATERARDELRRESGELAIALASKLIGENVDSAKNRALVDSFTKEM